MKEIELKFGIATNNIHDLKLFLNQWTSCDQAEFETASKIQNNINELKLYNTYYDTQDYYLRSNGYGLRIRGTQNKFGKQFEITIKHGNKAVAGLHERSEFNANLPDDHLDLTLLPSSAFPKDCNITNLQKMLHPLFSTHFDRQTWLISFANSEIEVALDQGEIISDGKSKLIQEVELEIKQGNKDDLINFAIELSRFNLHLFSQSKASRGYRLLKNVPLNCTPFCLQIQHDLSSLLNFWQKNEEYALENTDLAFYQQLLLQISEILANHDIANESEFKQWQQAITSIHSVSDFAYSPVNTVLKLMLIAQLNKE
ncbi:CYTH domain-containing protein [Gilliamella sp. B2776]|uniref:CYTH domain-containing protein n=1 Tax=unclassified Gilliamella TaxID=2685620 RepID=UPI00226A996A|nr:MULTISPECIES: CYTH domain-containing protein [unclassified Gilliamella]MCX8649197.1 CYTH domain-containing protein [Gilliamella sp. B2779]MCX8652927.1 CYTH domain-containing protein [Gilliamella sp. B2737]MCX8655189.1 CYTH domain-containing protein [Gilliamella sp. B2894]MCX8691009.1 CYTH domain-containing protein [Gilliamella sp. B2776]MCX8694495.1 CYTH domain-containing protein [Gilliamella sp. B2881]